MWTLLQVERECTTVRVGLREVSSSPSVLSTHRAQGLFYQVSRGERSQLMLMHESLSSPDGIKSEEADCNPQSGSLGSPGSPGRRKSHQVGMGLPNKCKLSSGKAAKFGVPLTWMVIAKTQSKRFQLSWLPSHSVPACITPRSLSGPGSSQLLSYTFSGRFLKATDRIYYSSIS